MRVGVKRTLIARLVVALGFLCGFKGLNAGLNDVVGILTPEGWFTGGALLTLLALFLLVDGAIAFEKAQT